MGGNRTALFGFGAAAIVAAGIGGYLVTNGVGAKRDCFGGVTGADIGGPFSLIDAAGERVTDADLRGQPLLIYFGYAFCPDICPTELADIAAATEILEAEYDVAIQPVFITVDPERDTTERMREFVPFFHERMIGLTGTLEETGAAAKAYRVYYRKAPDPDFPDGYAMDHSSFIYLVNADGGFITYYKLGATPEQIAEGVACHLGV